ncbi:macrolide family glycosyltransferase [Polyangium sp. 6x1]|uniref:macrolide family glycosyltransferase n=1 Tax=Polyangium sp. 6x1 TaxID=3042689 RepID=UPI0024824EA2|nr:macrolide family glycosyltransferase [Polyangium sp. 6x1]MDI1449906.1 glycosyltransferase [Polyangium sp. 6x1]
MSKIVFVGMPAHGHVNPTLPVVQELVRRGEQVIYYVAEEFRPQIERIGATFQAYPGGTLASKDIAEAIQSGDLTRVVRVILQATESLLPFLLDELPQKQPDVVAFDSNALWGRMAATKLNLPMVSLMTTFIPNPAQFPRLTLREWIHMLRPILPSIPGVVSARSRVVRRFGQSLYPPKPTLPMRGGTNIVFVPRDLQPDNALIDETFHFVGPTIDPEAPRGDLPFDASGAGPFIYISLGTLHRGSTDFWHQCFEAFAEIKAQFIVSVGKGADLQALGESPPNFIVRDVVPQIDVLRHAAVFITHGGMNSVLEGLYHGVPLILIPQQYEQLMTALNVAAKGAGLVLRGHMAGKRVTAAELRGALETILAEPRFGEAAKRAQTSLRATGGYRRATDEIQAFVARSARPRT